MNTLVSDIIIIVLNVYQHVGRKASESGCRREGAFETQLSTTLTTPRLTNLRELQFSLGPAVRPRLPSQISVTPRSTGSKVTNFTTHHFDIPGTFEQSMPLQQMHIEQISSEVEPCGQANRSKRGAPSITCCCSNRGSWSMEQHGVFVYQCAKLRMLQFHCDFCREDYQICEINMDLLYIALSTDTQTWCT
ncbi:hypothetical protein ElyMa_006732300 [Elysia marginata]|uniref:Uncharacterized protein n=1 Tax=Elysia marginata TaxID=1093978 RepID=A0AAV4IVB4_9GAST|nr:hypothetical protein ElyMa_006732300 [Elysia marginata]